MRTIIAIILIVLAGWWIADKAYKEFYLFADKKPFWSGTEEVQVCKAPDYTSSDCKRLKVELVDNNQARINYFVTKKVKEQTEGVPTEEEFKQAYFNAMMAGDSKSAETIKETSEYVHPDKSINVEQQLDVFDLECKFGSELTDQPRFVVCNGEDRSGQEWDFIPTWININ